MNFDIIRAIQIGTGGHKDIPKDWISPTSLRNIILKDNCMIWLKYHGRQHGFTEDDTEGSMMEFITGQGSAFEEKWLKEMACEAVRGSESDVAVRQFESFLNTLELMHDRVPVITKSAMWSAKDKTVGSCDMVALASWLRVKFPDLAPFLGDPHGEDFYCVLDMKNQRGLDTPAKAKDLLLASTQVGLYTKALGELQGIAPSHAFLVTPDRISSPIPVPVSYKLGDSLKPDVAEWIRVHNYIKFHGENLRPSNDEIVAPNYSNKKDSPWSSAKRQIRDETRSLEILPRVGRDVAEALRAVGFKTVDDLVKNGRRFDLSSVKGIGKEGADQLEAVLRANSGGNDSAPNIPEDVIPPRRRIELFIDYEFITSTYVDFEKDWPHLRGREQIFMIGAGWIDSRGQWQFKRFTADAYTLESERKLLEEFVVFLREKGVVYGSVQEATVCPEGEAALWHWSPAEVGASKRAAERLGVDVIGQLPWVDLMRIFKDTPIVLPGQFGFSIKEVGKALGKLSPEHKCEYPPSLAAGGDAMVLGIKAYENGGDVLNSPEMKLVGEYLEIDCKGLSEILRWLRESDKSGDEDFTSPHRAVKGRETASHCQFSWYRIARILSNDRANLPSYRIK